MLFYSLLVTFLFFINIGVSAQDIPNTVQLADDNIIPKIDSDQKDKTSGILPDISLSDLAKKVISNDTHTQTKDINLVSEMQTKKDRKAKANNVNNTTNKAKSENRKVLVLGGDGSEAIVKDETANTLSDPSISLTSQTQPIAPDSDTITFSQSSINKSNNEHSSIKVFNENIRYSKGGELEFIILPSGSSATATLLGGVNISTEERSIEVNLDSAFIGPNDAVVELKGCIAWLKLSANYNDERLYGNGQTISCRTNKGNTFEIPILAHVKGDDEYLGVKGSLVANGKMKAGALEFIKDGIAGYAEARAKTQTTTSISTSENIGAVADNVTGNGSSYALNKAISSSADNRFLNWYIDHYSSLAPTIAVPPGTKIFLTIQGEVKVPREFFSQSGIKYNTNAEYLKAQKRE